MNLEESFWPTLSTVVSIGIGLVIDIALLILALTAVRWRSATASMLMGIGAGVMLLLTLASPLAYAGAARMGAGMDSYLMIYSILGIAVTVLRSAAWALVLAGIYKVAIATRDGGS